MDYPFEEQRRYRDAGYVPYGRCRIVGDDGQPTGPVLEFISYPWGEPVPGQDGYVLVINVRDLLPSGEGDQPPCAASTALTLL
jgi:hypothetical protein